MQWCLAWSHELFGFLMSEMMLFRSAHDWTLRVEGPRVLGRDWQVTQFPGRCSSRLQWSSYCPCSRAEGVQSKRPSCDEQDSGAQHVQSHNTKTTEFTIVQSALYKSPWMVVYTLMLVYSDWLNFCSNIDLNIASENRLLMLLSLHNTLIFE